MSDNPRRCPSCGVELPANAPDGICPRCLLQNALGGDGPEPFSHEVSVSFEPGRTSVLASLAESIGGVPQVLLRDTDPRDDTSPVVRPASPEMPGPEGRSSRYQFLGEIARGGMGAVLKGRDPDLGRDLAIKVLLEAHRDKPELIRRFIEEAQIGGQLQHPGIVPVYELGSFADRRPFFAMKLVKGRTLAVLLGERNRASLPSVPHPPPGADATGLAESSRIGERGCVSAPSRRQPAFAGDLSRFLSIFESIAQTMAYSHARGVIHRDLKPSNVMVGSFGEVQVMDWGLAKVLPSGGAVDDQPPERVEPEPLLSVIRTARADGDASQAGSILGTPGYMAPEQARGDVELVDERADVFGLGAILCEILTGEPAFAGRTVGETQRKAARGDLADAFGRLAGCGADPDLIALAKDCLAPERDDRPRQAGQVATQITAYLTGVQERLRKAELARVEANARAEEERKRRRLTVALAASILALVTVGGGAAAWQIQQRQAQLTKVETTLARIQTLRDQAAKDGANSDRWETVLAAARDALDSIGDLAASEPGRRLAALRAKIAEDQKQAKRDRLLIDELSATEKSVENNSPNLDRGFAEAFNRYELDLETTAVNDAIAHLASRPESFVREVVGGLDRWLVSRHDAIPFGDDSQKKALPQNLWVQKRALGSAPARQEGLPSRLHLRFAPVK